MKFSAFFSQSVSSITPTSPIAISSKFKWSNHQENNGSNVITNWPKKFASRMYRAVKKNKLKDIKNLLKDRSLINIPLKTDGPLAGYTALHMACMKLNQDLVQLLVEDYHADVNVVADDGAQPIHLACLFEDVVAAEILLKAGANVEAELRQDLFSKYVKDKVWCSDFGDKITIFTFAVVYTDSFIAEDLIGDNANLEIKGLKNKTLLMYALENDNSAGEKIVLKKFDDREFINARDDDGFLAIHYLLHPKKFGDFRYDGKQSDKYEEWRKGLVISSLISAGIDIYATINGDPDTLLLNMAAYRSSASILNQVLPHYDYITKSKALYYATLPLKDPQKTLRPNDFQNEERQREFLRKQRQLSTELILKDLVNRRTFGLPVPEGEKQLMDELIATDTNIGDLVHNYEKNFIQGTLKNKVIQYDYHQSITVYDFILKVCKDKTLRLLVKNRILMDAFEEFSIDSADYSYFHHLLTMRIRRALKRVELLDKLNEIEQLRNAIPVMYKFILEMTEYLSNQDLEFFINAFVSN